MNMKENLESYFQLDYPTVRASSPWISVCHHQAGRGKWWPCLDVFPLSAPDLFFSMR